MSARRLPYFVSTVSAFTNGLRCNTSPRRTVTFLALKRIKNWRFHDKTRAKCNTMGLSVTWAQQ